MPTILESNAIEKSTYVVTASFYDENEAAVVPNAGLTWSLSDEFGNIVNSRSAVPITAAATINIVLSGNDLSVSNSNSLRRIVTIQGTYNSTLGSNLPIKDEVQFDISNLTVIS